MYLQLPIVGTSILRRLAEEESPAAPATPIAGALAFSPSADGGVRGGLRKWPLKTRACVKQLNSY
ncbi:hypothetical protein KsCSTR_26300 [Candidatus Kuenenia stuttgartiensis]|uniref:Uncharacterized protein n=1 Tax=Kuenenia stuttgartiensis TaxID=174633 RepID=Q1Q776_KUEST|nr:hypothetical protein KsCSTR_26300 [Candidatus Kuenenia stuttgartiensis]TVM01892.1 MAG: hypothetical protein CV080_02945 [Candidatus Kuenenia stuttgartiensis]CAJ73434.1 unknown protein [Candidatus Kuenenia stuttgartiensis]SOH06437.1 hypothetical protein KSMBR1_3965 [Candidatus Kuenenia stuttgartiensis]